jgi:2-dehydropantoate 2-reductase
MRILVLGAGGIGGYFGGRLLEAGRDVTFLVRPRRAELLAVSGLRIRSRRGDAFVPAPPTVLAGAIQAPFDLILLSCKAYDLDSAMRDIAPAVGPQTVILPMLNGMRHLDALDERFGAERVLGGFCLISVALEPSGEVVHYNNIDALVFGERDFGERDTGEGPAAEENLDHTSPRTEAIAAMMAGAKFEARLSPRILQEMWEKWIFIASGAAVACLMRAAITDLVAADAVPTGIAMLEECAAIAAAEGFAPRGEKLVEFRTALSRSGSLLIPSMLRDVERHAPVESEQIIGDLLRRGEKHAVQAPMMRLAYEHLKVYEARRAREDAAQGK